MLTLRPTLKLARRLKLPAPRISPPVANRVADWCVHEFMIGRQRHLIFCNTPSLYPMVAVARGVTDEASLIERFVETAKMNLRKSKLKPQLLHWILPELEQVQWAPIPGRSVLGSINDFVHMAQVHALYFDALAHKIGPQIAESPMSLLGMNSPDRVFPKLTGQ